MNLTCRPIPLDSINFNDEWSLHPWNKEHIPKELQESLAQNGIIHPPVIAPDSETTFSIVSGTRRVRFIREQTGPSQIDCMVIKKDVLPLFILNLILTDQGGGSALSLAEKARFAQIACRHLNMDDVLTTFQKKLHLKSGRSTIPNLLKILEQDEMIIKEIHAGLLQYRMVLDILSLQEKTDRLALVKFFKYLGMGDGKQKRFFNLIRDIAFRNGSSINSFLQRKEISEILDHKEMNIPQKVHHLGSLLQRQLTPSSSLAEEAFAQQVKGLQLPNNQTLSHSPSFEKDHVTLSITFGNFADCKRYLDRQNEGAE